MELNYCERLWLTFDDKYLGDKSEGPCSNAGASMIAENRRLMSVAQAGFSQIKTLAAAVSLLSFFTA